MGRKDSAHESRRGVECPSILIPLSSDVPSDIPEALDVCTALDDALNKLVLQHSDSDLSAETPSPHDRPDGRGDDTSGDSDDSTDLEWSLADSSVTGSDEGDEADSADDGTPDAQRDAAPQKRRSTATKRQKKITSVVKELRTEKLEKLHTAKQNDLKMKRRRRAANRVVNALFLLPYHPNEVKTKIPFTVRENILGLLGALTAIHLEDILALNLPDKIYGNSNQSHHKQSVLEYNAKYSHWGTKFIKALATVLGIEGCMLAWDLVRITEFYRNGKVLSDLPLDMLNLMNPQPRKTSIIDFCNSALQVEIEEAFEEHKRTNAAASFKRNVSAPPATNATPTSSSSVPSSITPLSVPVPISEDEYSSDSRAMQYSESFSFPDEELGDGGITERESKVLRELLAQKHNADNQHQQHEDQQQHSNAQQHVQQHAQQHVQQHAQQHVQQHAQQHVQQQDIDSHQQHGAGTHTSTILPRPHPQTVPVHDAACPNNDDHTHDTKHDTTGTQDTTTGTQDTTTGTQDTTTGTQDSFTGTQDGSVTADAPSEIRAEHSTDLRSAANNCTTTGTAKGSAETTVARCAHTGACEDDATQLSHNAQQVHTGTATTGTHSTGGSNTGSLNNPVAVGTSGDLCGETQCIDACGGAAGECASQMSVASSSSVPKPSSEVEDENAGWLIPFRHKKHNNSSTGTDTTAAESAPVTGAGSNLLATPVLGHMDRSSFAASVHDLRLPDTPPNAAALLLRNIVMAYVLSTGNFDARVQRVFSELALALDLTPSVYQCILCQIATHISVYCLYANTKESNKQKQYRRLKIAGVAVGVGVLTALTAGLAAPAVGAGIAAMGIAGTSGMTAFLTTAGGAAVFASLFGAGSMSLAGWKYSKRIAKLQKFEFVLLAKKVDALSEMKSETDQQSESVESLTVPKGRSRRRSFVGFALPSTTGGEHKKKKDSSKHSSKHSSRQHMIRRSLGLNVCVSGLITKGYSDFVTQWDSLGDIGEDVYTLLWEPNDLQRLGNILETMISEAFALSATKLWLHYTVAGALSAALMWPIVLIQYSAGLDNAWTVCRIKAEKAGKVLAEAITDKQAVGQRPVTLIGYSMGARVVFECLQELHRKREFFCVYDAIMLGLPSSTCASKWGRARTVVSNRLVNVYCRSDWVLGFLYRYMEWGTTVAGLTPVKCIGAVENFDVTGLVKSHNDYASHIREILAFINFHAPLTKVCQQEVLQQMEEKSTVPLTTQDKDEQEDDAQTPQQLYSSGVAVDATGAAVEPTGAAGDRAGSVHDSGDPLVESPAGTPPQASKTRKPKLQRHVKSRDMSSKNNAVPAVTTNTIPAAPNDAAPPVARKQVRMQAFVEPPETEHRERRGVVRKMTMSEQLVADFTAAMDREAAEGEDGENGDDNECGYRVESDVSESEDAKILRYKTRDYMF